MKINNRILKAINEGIRKGLLAFDDDQTISFEQSDNNLYNAAGRGISMQSIDLVKDAIYSKGLFLPKELGLDIEDNEYFFGDETDNSFVMMSKHIRSFNTKDGIRTTLGFMVEANGPKITISIPAFGGSGEFFEQSGGKCFISDYVNDFAELKKLPGCGHLIFDKLRYCDVKGVHVDNIHLYAETLDNTEGMPDKIEVIDIHNDNAMDHTYFEGNIMTGDRMAVISSPENTDSIEVSKLKQYIKYLNNSGFRWVLIEPTLYSYEDFTLQKLYYDYDMPNLDEMTYEYGIRFDVDDINKFRHQVGLFDYFIMDAKKINNAIYRLSGQKKVEKLIDDGSIKKINDFINKQVVRFATILWLRKTPFYRSYIEYRLSCRNFGTAYHYYKYSEIDICRLMEPIMDYANHLGYEKREIIDRMEIACRFLDKYGLGPACEIFAQLKKKRGRK